MENERLFAEKLRAESDQQWAQKLESLKQEMHRMTIEQQKAAAELLAGRTDETDLAVPDLFVDLMHVAANTEAPPFFIKIFANKKRAQNILHPYHDTKSPKALFSMIDPFALLGVRTNAPLFFVLLK